MAHAPGTLTARMPHVAAVTLAAVAFGWAASDARAAFPSHRVGGIECVSGGVLRASPPASMLSTRATDFRHPEMVWWHPRLERWRAGKWRRLVRAAPVYYAFTSSYGFYQAPLQQAWHQVGRPASQVLFHPFSNLAPGHYRVMNRLRWAWYRPDLYHVHPSANYCTYA